MRRPGLSFLVVAALALPAAVAQAGPRDGARTATSTVSAASLPTLQTVCQRGDRYRTCYLIKPRHIGCQVACGGEFTLTWSSWTSRDAFGSGESVNENMGSVARARVRVEAFAPRDGHFTRLRIAFGKSPLRGPGVRDLGGGLWGEPV